MSENLDEISRFSLFANVCPNLPAVRSYLTIPYMYMPKAEIRFAKDTGPTYVMTKMIHVGLRLVLCLSSLAI